MNTNLSPNDVMEVDQEEKEEKGMDFVSHGNCAESQTEMSYTSYFSPSDECAQSYAVFTMSNGSPTTRKRLMFFQ